MSLIKSWNAFWDPPRFQGRGRKRSYFEGWYFKLISVSGDHKLAVIPGISYDSKGTGQAFIQILDSTLKTGHFIPFPTSAFEASADKFEVQVDKSIFHAGGIRLDLPELSGQLHFRGNVPWTPSWKAPGIMGWYAYAPFMQCYHGLVSMDHTIEGELRIGDRTVDFTGGRGYIEKDWGSSFPKAWIWGQSNHFEKEPGTSLMISVAHIPWMGHFFIGFLCAFYFRGRLRTLATWTGAKRKTTIKEKGVRMDLWDGQQRLEVTAIKAPGTDLISPLSGAMTGKVNESLDARLGLKYYENEELVFEDTGMHAGLELGGEDVQILTTDPK